MNEWTSIFTFNYIIKYIIYTTLILIFILIVIWMGFTIPQRLEELRKRQTLSWIKERKWDKIQPGSEIEQLSSFYHGVKIYDHAFYLLQETPFTKEMWDTFIKLHPHIDILDFHKNSKYILYLIQHCSTEVIAYMLDNYILTVEKAIEFIIYHVKGSYIPFYKKRRLIEMLYERCTNLNIQNDNGITILHALCMDIKGLYIYNDGSYLHHQERFDHVLDLTRYLLEKGADPLLRCKKGYNTFDYFNNGSQMFPLTKPQTKKFRELLTMFKYV